MKSRNRQSVAKALRWDFLAIGAMVLFFTGYLTVTDSDVVNVTSEAMSGSRPPDRTAGDVLLLLPDTPSAEANHFDELDCSYAWFNTLWQEYGSFATAVRHDLSPEILAGRTVVVVPARVAANMPQNGVNALKRFVETGGQLIVERPTEVWASIASVHTGASRHAQRLTSVEGLQLRGDIRDQLLEVPLSGPLTPAPPMESFPDGSMLLEIDGQPGLLADAVGKGWVYTFLYNHGCSTQAIQQGRPPQDTTSFATGKASARALEARDGGNPVPLSDMLDRAILRRLSVVRPTARFWYYPGSFSGAAILTISAADDVGSALAFADHARQMGGVSTIYVAADRLDETQAALAEDAHAEIGLNWIRGINRPRVTEENSMGGLRPTATELDLNGQFTRLNLALPESEPLRVGRIEESEIGRGWSNGFQVMAAGRLRLSSTLGPAGPDQWGYVFGTGFPFYPIDSQGLPLPLLESPFTLRGAGISLKRLEALLDASESGFYQPIVLNIPSDVMQREPSAGVLLAFRQIFDLAEEHDHWVAKHGELLDFLSARRRSVLTSQFNAERRRLTVSTNTLGSRATSLENGAVPSVAVPRLYEGQPIASIELDEKPVNIRKLAKRGDEIILETGPGRHVVAVTYAKPQPIILEDRESEED